MTRSRRLSSGLLQATRLDGVIRVTSTPTGAARAIGCRGSFTGRERLVLLRR